MGEAEPSPGPVRVSSVASRVAGVFFSTVGTFESLAQRPTWLAVGFAAAANVSAGQSAAVTLTLGSLLLLGKAGVGTPGFGG